MVYRKKDNARKADSIMNNDNKFKRGRKPLNRGSTAPPKKQDTKLSMSEEARITSSRGFNNVTSYRRMKMEFVKSNELYEHMKDMTKVRKNETSEDLDKTAVKEKVIPNGVIEEAKRVSSDGVEQTVGETVGDGERGSKETIENDETVPKRASKNNKIGLGNSVDNSNGNVESEKNPLKMKETEHEIRRIHPIESSDTVRSPNTVEQPEIIEHHGSIGSRDTVAPISESATVESDIQKTVPLTSKYSEARSIELDDTTLSTTDHVIAENTEENSNPHVESNAVSNADSGSNSHLESHVPHDHSGPDFIAVNTEKNSDASNTSDASDAADPFESSKLSSNDLQRLKKLALRDLGGSEMPDSDSDDSKALSSFHAHEISESSNYSNTKKSKSHRTIVSQSLGLANDDEYFPFYNDKDEKSDSDDEGSQINELIDENNKVLAFVSQLLAVQHNDSGEHLVIKWHKNESPIETETNSVPIEDFYEFFRGLGASDSEIERGLKYLGYEPDDEIELDELDEILEQEFLISSDDSLDDDDYFQKSGISPYGSDDDVVEGQDRYEKWQNRQLESGEISTSRSRKNGKMPDFSQYGEMQHSLETQWVKSREAKKLKKAEREKLRQQGKLSRRGKKDKNSIYIRDLFDDYLEQMSFTQLEAEMIQFIGTETFRTLFFPPFDPNANWIIKQVCQAFGLKVRIQNGCVLAVKLKNQGTDAYLSANMVVVNQLRKRRKVFRRTDAKPLNTKDTENGNKGKGGPRRSVQEGEIVGRTADELGTDNLGRKLLEKMGWSQGMGLGTTNIGITEPILAKMKKTKWGIGA